MIKQIIESKLYDYLKLKNIKITKKGPTQIIDCPICKAEQMCIKIPNIHKFNCHACKERLGVFEFAKALEEKYPGTEKEQIHYLKELLGVEAVTEVDEENIDRVLDFYKAHNFDLVPLVKNDKKTVETGWTKKEHKNIEEWKRWIVDGLNIGVKTGTRSGITIIDIDAMPKSTKDDYYAGKLTEQQKKEAIIERDKILKETLESIGYKGDSTLEQYTLGGMHLIYKYIEELPKTRIDEYKIDLENDGGQVVISPSKVDNISRKITLNPIIEMPEELKKLLLSKVTIPRKTASEEIMEDIKDESFNIKAIKSGERNSALCKLGGMFRKQLNSKQTEYVLRVLNKHACESPLPNNEITAMSRKLEHYTGFDENELAHNIIEYLKTVEEANRTEIAMACVSTNRGEDKKRVDRALNYLIQEEILVKKGTRYTNINSLEWSEDLLDTGIPINFKMPYFHGYAGINYGDLIIIGSQNKYGKTHLAMNFVKKLVMQGIKPDYIYNESGGRYAKVALKLGMKNGDFSSAFVADSFDAMLRKDKITIFDWVKPNDFARTDNVFSNLVEKVKKTKGVLICFVQLRTDDSYFAKDQIGQFPAILSRYLYEDESGENTKFAIDSMREPLIKGKKWQIPCRYDWDTKIADTVADLQGDTIQEENKTTEEEVF